MYYHTRFGGRSKIVKDLSVIIIGISAYLIIVTDNLLISKFHPKVRQ